jgi:hypothetical protein
MKYTKLKLLLFLGAIIFISSCTDDAENTDDSDDSSDAVSTPISAFDEFNSAAVTVSYDGDEITIDSNGVPNHTSPYWEETNALHIDQIVAVALTPGNISDNRSYSLTVDAAPEIAASSTATGLGAIGISVTAAPIFNDLEGNKEPIEELIAETFDYAGAHNGPSGYHYHIESSDVPENTELSFNDSKLVGILGDGFLLYGRKEADGSYPTDLDESGGHFGVTPHSDGVEIYHYHIVNEYYFGTVIALFAGDLQGTPNSVM